MSAIENLKSSCKNLEESLNELAIGATSHKNTVPIEEKILDLQASNELLETKIKAIQVSRTGNSSKNYNIENLPNAQSDNITALIKKQLEDQACKTPYLGYVGNKVVDETQDQLKQDVLIEKIREQLKLLRHNSDKLKELNSQLQKHSSEDGEELQELYNQQTIYKSTLEEEKLKYKMEYEKILNEEYNEEMNKIDERIRKINFMQIVIKRLLTFGDLSKKPELQELFAATRKQFTIEDFSKE